MQRVDDFCRRHAYLLTDIPLDGKLNKFAGMHYCVRSVMGMY